MYTDPTSKYSFNDKWLKIGILFNKVNNISDLSGTTTHMMWLKFGAESAKRVTHKTQNVDYYKFLRLLLAHLSCSRLYPNVVLVVTFF